MVDSTVAHVGGATTGTGMAGARVARGSATDLTACIKEEAPAAITTVAGKGAGTGAGTGIDATESTTLSTTGTTTNNKTCASSSSDLDPSPPASQTALITTTDDTAVASPDSDQNNKHHPSLILHSHRQSHNQSKLPAFRFADRLHGPASVSSPSLVPRGPPSPVSPNPNPDTTADSHKPLVSDTVISPALTTSRTDPYRNRVFPVSPLTDDSAPDFSPTTLSPNHTAATADTNSDAQHSSAATTAAAAGDSTRAKRPASLPDSPAPAQASAPAASSRERPWQSRRGPTSRSSSDSAISEGGYLTSRNRQRILAAATDKSTKEGASGRRELLLPKTLSQTATHDGRRDSVSNRPPVSYKPPSGGSATQSVPTTPVRVPPIRGFRSSISRKSLNLDMNFSRPFDAAADVEDPTHDHTLRALEGRRESDGQMTLPPSGYAAEGTADDEGDMFLRIARQETANRAREGQEFDDSQSSVSRVMRSSHRRPLSTNVATYTPTSPPQLTRRLSDQQETSRSRRYLDERGTEVSRSNTTRFSSRDKASSIHPSEDLGRFRSSQRPPLTPRAPSSTHDQSYDGAFSGRRRPSITDSNSGSQARTPVFKSYAQTQGSATKTYSSSPLVRSFDLNGQQGQERSHGVEGTESSLSTAAPSTVWDELDDIRSRINRLELTGKLPSTSGAAVSRLSDDRPATAGTTVTTVSSSPKRHGAGVAQTEVGSTTSSQREAHPVLHTALTRSKAYLSPDVFRALESAANDAMSLSSMMGLPGQPGPISSGASTIGAGTTLTDRQLRRKADSVCRSLTELCVALGEDLPPAKTPQAAQSVVHSQTDGPATPVAAVPYHGTASQRRPSVSAESNLPKAPSSPKSISKFEERRQTLLNGSLLPSPRVSGSSPATPATPIEASNRRSSLLISRTRRAGTEEPEDGRGSSLLMRARRAGTEEPEEGRRTSLLVRNRRGTIGEDDAESRLRAPSRATTEVNTVRSSQNAQSASSTQDISSPSYSALPRRRLPSSINTSRLATPTSLTTPPARRYLERSTASQEANTYSEAPADNRGHRLSMIGQSSLPARTASLSTRRQNRDSTITSSSTAATAGGSYD
ncbi:LPXTG-motif cell wall anchor domain protein [Sarocladium implicatum]|nr:LPXTG-motif cell wall anchor domain protein [Sarocladium implicatum]